KAQTYAQTDEYIHLTKQLFRAWVAFMQEDTFFEMLQHNMDCHRTGGEPKPFHLPETLQALAVALENLQNGYVKVLAKEVDELQGFEFGTTRYNFDLEGDEFDCDESSDCTMSAN